MSDFSEIDFCKGRALRIARRFDVSEGITSDELAGATSLGCNFPVSHRASSAPGFILSRVNKQSGKDILDLLESANESVQFNPGPTAWLSAAPDTIITGSAATPFPAARPAVTPSLAASGGPVQLSFQAIGFGGSTGFRTTVVVPPGNLEYLDPGPLADHATRWYYGCVSSSNVLEAYRLIYATQNTVTGVRDVYIWPGVAGQGTSVTLFAEDNWEHHVGVSVVGIPPALNGYDTRVKTAPTEAYDGPLPATVGTNGPEQTQRKFSYPFLGSSVNPPLNGSSALGFALTNTRPTLTAFRQSEFDGFFGGFSVLSCNGTPLSFGGTTLPADQYGSPSGLAFGFTAAGATSFYDSGLFGNPAGASQGRLYGPVDSAAQMEIDLAATSLNFQIRAADQIVGQPTANFTITIPKTAGQVAWFECLITVYSRHVGVLS